MGNIYILCTCFSLIFQIISFRFYSSWFINELCLLTSLIRCVLKWLICLLVVFYCKQVSLCSRVLCDWLQLCLSSLRWVQVELPVLFSWVSVAVPGAELTPAELLPADSVQGDEAELLLSSEEQPGSCILTESPFIYKSQPQSVTCWNIVCCSPDCWKIVFWSQVSCLSKIHHSNSNGGKKKIYLSFFVLATVLFFPLINSSWYTRGEMNYFYHQDTSAFSHKALWRCLSAWLIIPENSRKKIWLPLVFSLSKNQQPLPLLKKGTITCFPIVLGYRRYDTVWLVHAEHRVHVWLGEVR